jgi:hypothetical protein
MEVHVPVDGLQLGSTVQVGEQPSPGVVLPSSQLSRPSLVRSPQAVRWQLVLEQAQPWFHRQVAEQACAMSVMFKPGSHCSLAMVMPSPQIVTQGAPLNGHS